MRPPLRIFLSFITVFTLIYGSAHLYVWWRLVPPLRLAGWGAWLARMGFLFLFVAFPLIHFVYRQGNGPVLDVVNFVCSVWMGMLVYLVLGAFGYDVARLVTWGALPAGRVMTATVAGLAVAITVYGLIEARWIGVTRLTVRLPNAPAELRIVQISDVHLGRLVRETRLEKIVRRVNALQPDVIVITGDLVDAEPSHLEELLPTLRRLQSKHGVFAVTGNHEFFAGVERVEALLERAGVTLLRNRWVDIGGVQLVGRDDVLATRITGVRTPSLAEILRGIDGTRPVVLLDHTPVTTLAELAARGIQLQLSGHTHQGQLWPFNFLVKQIFRTPYGLVTDGQATIYVNRGIGTWGPPLRVLARPEITLVTLARCR